VRGRRVIRRRTLLRAAAAAAYEARWAGEGTPDPDPVDRPAADGRTEPGARGGGG